LGSLDSIPTPKLDTGDGGVTWGSTDLAPAAARLRCLARLRARCPVRPLWLRVRPRLLWSHVRPRLLWSHVRPRLLSFRVRFRLRGFSIRLGRLAAGEFGAPL